MVGCAADLPHDDRGSAEIEPGGPRELHWHPDNDAWQYYIVDRARTTVFIVDPAAEPTAAV